MFCSLRLQQRGRGGRQDVEIMGFLNCRLSSTSCRLNLQHEVDPVTPIHRKFLGASDVRKLFLIIDPTRCFIRSSMACAWRWLVKWGGTLANRQRRLYPASYRQANIHAYEGSSSRRRRRAPRLRHQTTTGPRTGPGEV